MTMFLGRKLSQRLAILIGLFTIGFVIYATWSFKTLNDLKVNGPTYQRIVQGKDLIADILPPPEYIIESYLVSLQLAAATGQTEQEALIARLKGLKAEYDTRHAFWLKEALDSNLSNTFLKDAHNPAAVFYQIAFDDFVPAVQKSDKDAVASAMARMKQAYETHRAAIDQVVQLATKRNETDEASAKQEIESSTIALLVIFTLSLGLGIVVAVVITRSLLKSLGGEPEYAAQISHQIAAGDLTAKIIIKDNDQESLLYAMKAMQDMLAGTVSKLRSAVDTVNSGTQQIAAGNLDLAARTEKEAGALAVTASSMEELTSTVRQNADNASQASQLAESASEVAVKGGAMVSQVVETMGSINNSSKKIVDIIAVIDGIAFQTNILALNAAVEAARAGEQGRGFAVVAAEVRTLAQRSAAAAKEIKELIGASVEKVDAGAKLVDEAGATMGEIVTSVKRVNDIINEITSASREQIIGIEQVSRAINEMDHATQQNNSLVEKASSTASSLTDQTANLAQIINMFRIESTHRSVTPIAASAPAKRPTRAAPAPKNTLPQPKPPVVVPMPRQLARPKSGQEDDWEEF